MWDFEDYLNNPFSDYWLKEIVKYDCVKSYLKYLSNREKDKKRFRYLVTFTLDPKKHALTDEYYQEVEDYIITLSSSVQYKPVHWAYVREYTKAGTAHRYSGAAGRRRHG